MEERERLETERDIDRVRLYSAYLQSQLTFHIYNNFARKKIIRTK